MKYLNAKKGIKKNIISLYFAIFAAFIMSGSNLFTTAFINDTVKSNSHLFLIVATLILFLSIVSFFLLAVTSGLAIFGCFQASADEPEFRKAAFCAVASGVLTITGIIFQIPNGMLYTLFITAGTIVEMFFLVYVVSGIINLSQNRGRTDLSKRGEFLLKLLLVTYIISSLNAIVIRIFELSDHSKIVSVIVQTIDLILNVVRYIVFLGYLKNSVKMLTESISDELE